MRIDIPQLLARTLIFIVAFNRNSWKTVEHIMKIVKTIKTSIIFEKMLMLIVKTHTQKLNSIENNKGECTHHPIFYPVIVHTNQISLCISLNIYIHMYDMYPLISMLWSFRQDGSPVFSWVFPLKILILETCFLSASVVPPACRGGTQVHLSEWMTSVAIPVNLSLLSTQSPDQYC